MHKVLIDHNCGVNFGDQAMLVAVATQVNKAGITGEIVPRIDPAVMLRAFNMDVPLARPLPTTTYGHLFSRRFPVLSPAVRRALMLSCWYSGRSPKALLNYIEPYEAVWFAGGGYLNDAFPNNLLEKALLARAFVEQGKPCILTGVQLGPCHRRVSLSALAYIINHATFLGVRDPVSEQRANQQGGSPMLMGDDACGAIDWLDRKPLSAISTNLTYNLRQSAYERPSEAGIVGLVDTIDGAIEQGTGSAIGIAISTGVGEDDIASAQGLRGRSRQPSRWKIPQADGGSSFASLVDTLADSSLASGNPCHFLTFSGLCGVPFIALYHSAYYRHKAQGLARLRGQVDPLPIGQAFDPDMLAQARSRAASVAERRIEMVDVWRKNFQRALACLN